MIVLDVGPGVEAFPAEEPEPETRAETRNGDNISLHSRTSSAVSVRLPPPNTTELS